MFGDHAADHPEDAEVPVVMRLLGVLHIEQAVSVIHPWYSNIV